jgi:hypothetical protein
MNRQIPGRAPWHWVNGHWDVDKLVDADGTVLIDANSTGTIHIRNPRVRALTGRAGELRTALVAVLDVVREAIDSGRSDG